jgi:hypothetical protein
MREFDRRRQVGDEHRDGGSSYVIVRAEETESRPWVRGERGSD